jgi:hypothetical protein
MFPISQFFGEIETSGITLNIISDSRGISPGGTVILSLVRGDRSFATLLIRSLHQVNRFDDIDSYQVTEVSIDNAEVIVIRKPTTATQLWKKLETLLDQRHAQAKAALSRLPNSNRRELPQDSRQPHPSRPGCYQARHSPRYKQRRRRFPDHFYPPPV